MKFHSFGLAALLLVPLPALAQPVPPPTKLFSPAADIPALIAQAKAQQKSPEINSTVPIVTLMPYRVLLEYRTGLTPPTVHPKEAELVEVLEGSASLRTGGTLLGQKPPANPNSTTLSGTGIEGGTVQRIAKGDYIMIPPNTAHQFQGVQGAFIIMSLHMAMPEAK